MIYSSWDIERDELKLVIIGLFLIHHNFEKIKKKKKKMLEISSFCKCVPKTIIIWGTVPEIRSETDIMFYHFGPYFALPPANNRKIKILKKYKNCLEITSFYTCVTQMTIIWCTVPQIWSSKDRIFCHFGPVFALLNPLQTRKL